MSWLEVFSRAREELKKICESIQDVKEVYESIHATPKAFPCIYILPRRIVESPATTSQSHITMQFASQVANNQQERLDLLDQVRTRLLEDRTLNNAVDSLEVTLIEPEIAPPVATARFVASLTVELKKLL